MATQAGAPMKRVKMADGSVVLLPADAIVREMPPSDPAAQKKWLAAELATPIGGTY